MPVPVRIGEPLSLEDVVAVAVHGEGVEVSDGVPERMAAARSVVEDAVGRGRTGTGSQPASANLRTPIAPGEAKRLQRDIVRSQRRPVGRPFRAEVVRAMLLLRLAHSRSGSRASASISCNGWPRC